MKYIFYQLKLLTTNKYSKNNKDISSNVSLQRITIFNIKFKLRVNGVVFSRDKIGDPIRIKKHIKCDGFRIKYPQQFIFTRSYDVYNEIQIKD